MPTGYLNRISPTYWTSLGLNWSGSAWISSPNTEWTFVATAALESPILYEARFLIEVSGVTKVAMFITNIVGSPTVEQLSRVYVLKGVSNELLIVRATGASFRFVLDASSAIIVSEIECGFNGFFP